MRDKFTELSSHGRLRPVLILSSVSVDQLPASVRGDLFFLTPLKEPHLVEILKDVFDLGPVWKPNSVLRATLQALAGPPRLLLGLLCVMSDTRCSIDAIVDIDAIRRCLKNHDDAHSNGRDLQMQRQSHHRWITTIMQSLGALLLLRVSVSQLLSTEAQVLLCVPVPSTLGCILLYVWSYCLSLFLTSSPRSSYSLTLSLFFFSFLLRMHLVMFAHPARLSHAFVGRDNNPRLLTNLLTLGVVYVRHALAYISDESAVCLTWPPIYLQLLPSAKSRLPALVVNTEITRESRRFQDNEDDDVAVLRCRAEMLCALCAPDARPSFSLCELVPSMAADNPLASIQFYGRSEVRHYHLCHQTDSEDQLESLVDSCPPPSSFVNASQASFADSFLLLLPVDPYHPALRRLAVHTRAAMETRQSKPSSSRVPGRVDYFLLGISSKAHTVPLSTEYVDAEVEKIARGFPHGSTVAWALIHITDATNPLLGDQHKFRVVLVSKKDYATFAGTMMSDTRRCFDLLGDTTITDSLLV